MKSISDIAESIGEDRSNTKRLLKLNDLIPDLQSLVSAGKLGTCAAEQLSYLTKKDQQMLLDTLGKELAERTLAETKELRQKLQEGTQSKTRMEKKQVELLNQIKDAEKTIEEYENQICEMEEELKKSQEAGKNSPEHVKLKLEAKHYQWEIDQLKIKLDGFIETNKKLEKELDEKKSVLRSFTAAQIEAGARKKIRTLLTVMVQDLGKHLKHVQIEIQAFSPAEDDEELHSDVASCARILRESADQLENIIKTRSGEVIDIDPER